MIAGTSTRSGTLQGDPGCYDGPMAVVDISELPGALPSGRRLLGLDLGKRTIGLAISDSMLAVASPLETIKRGKFTADAERLAEIMRAREVGGLVVGLPLNMNGSEGPRCQSTRAFVDNLLARMDLPAAFWDERLSTAAVERVLIDEADLSRKRRGRAVDKMAAAYILQGALDRMGN